MIVAKVARCGWPRGRDDGSERLDREVWARDDGRMAKIVRFTLHGGESRLAKLPLVSGEYIEGVEASVVDDIVREESVDRWMEVWIF